jgi:phosphomethylpyrimidine synthase
VLYASLQMGPRMLFEAVLRASSPMQVPFRRVQLTNGEHFDLYDTSGPQVGFRV